MADQAGRKATAGRYDCAACGLSDEVCAALLYGEGSDRGCCRACAHTVTPPARKATPDA